MQIDRVFLCRVLWLMLFVSGHAVVSSQSRVVKVEVVSADDSLPIPYANIRVSEINLHTISNPKGMCEFVANFNDSLSVNVSIIGYKSTLIKVKLIDAVTVITIPLKQSFTDIDEVVVTATRTERLLKNVPVLTQVISNRQIELSGNSSIAEVINTMRPGVDFYNEGRGLTFRMQGLAAKYTLFLIDGERIAGENRDNIDYERLVSGSVEKVEIVQGASSSLYGSNAIGGVVNLLTKTPVRPFESKIYTRFSKYNEIETGMNVGLKNKKVSFFADGFRKSSDGYDITQKSSDLYTVEPFESYSAFSKLVYDASPKLQFEARASYYTRERFDVSQRPIHPFYSDFSSGVKLKYKHSDRFSVQFSTFRDGYFSYDVLERRGGEKRINYGNAQLSSKLVSDMRFSGGSLPITHQVSTGMEYLYDDMFALRIQDSTKQFNTLSFFVQDEITIKNDFSVVIGARDDWNMESVNSICPKVSAMYKRGNFRHRASVASGFKLPTIKERYYDFDLGFIIVKGNEALVPEKSIYYSLSSEYITEEHNVSMTAYNNRLKDMIYETPIEGEPNSYTYHNFSSVNVYGLDLLARNRMMKNLNLTFGYSYTSAIDMHTKKQLIGVSKHAATFSLDYLKQYKKCSVGIVLSSKIYGEKKFVNLTDDAYLLFEDVYPTYSIWRLGITTKSFNKSIVLTLGVDNLFDYQTETDLININPGRRLFANLNISIDRLYDQLSTLKN